MRRPTRALSILLGLATMLVAQAVGPAAAAAAATPDFPANMSGYHNYPEMVAEIQQAEADFPDIVHVFSIGKSYQGRDIWAAKVSDNVAQDEDEPEVLIDALHHAREHLTTEQALATLRWLTQDYGTDDTVTRLVNTREIYLIFALNPDGMQYDLTGNPFRAWRKNRQPNPGPSVGTDLNRNYGYRLGLLRRLVRASAVSIDVPRRRTRSRRPRPGPCATSCRAACVDGVQQIRTHITFHTNGELILWPYGYTKTNVPPDMTALDQQTFVALGRAMAATNGYTAEQSSDLYITDGDQIDWLYATYRIFTYTFELYPTEKPTVWADHYPDDSKIANADGAQPAGDPAPHRPRGLPVRDARRHGSPGGLRAAVRRPRDQPRLVARPAGQGHGVVGAVGGGQPGGHELAWPEAAGRRRVRVARARHGGRGGPERRVERRRRRRDLDPQPPDHAPSRSRRLRPAHLLVRVRPLGDLDDRRFLPRPGRGRGRHPHPRVRAARGADQPQRLVANGLGLARRLARARRSVWSSPPRTAANGNLLEAAGRQHPHPALKRESRPDRWIGTALGGWRGRLTSAGWTAVNDVNMPFE